MKIKEAIKIINGTTSTVSAKYLNNALRISSKNTEIYGDWFLKMPMNVISWESIRKEWGGLSPNIKAKDLARVMDVIQQLLDTPVKERFPEKKYRLRWIDDQGHYKNYLNLNSNGAWVFVDDEIDAEIFTESELEQFKKDNPRFAPAIDAMKEEV
ncbi:hypothetical protein LMB21_09475 [Limosilactobacillus reuteri]|uniref:hypothetical protein n=1 Tax=Limosilactobacillus reuteri TaxID=1598 RepID=UPI001E2B7BDE|nr:hypothetical protein [Limosilactobacillus reuteri]MCC4367527.1 hypothetical protein [Limosilactobacillus reuteri]